MNKTLLVCDEKQRERGVLSAGYCKFEENGEREYTSRATRDYRLIYLERGRIRYIKSGRTVISASAPRLIFLAPGTRDTTICSSDCRDFWVSFSGFDEELSELGLSKNVALHKKCGESREVISKAFSDIIEELELKACGYSVAAEQRLLKLLLLFSRENLKLHPRRDSEKRKISPALIIMNEEIGKSYSVDYYAQKCNMSKSSFFHIFSRVMDTTPTKYINEIKMKNAESMLSETDMQISEIAEALGFSSAQYFSNTFFSYSGMRPGEYRKRHIL